MWQASPSLFTPIFQGGRVRRGYEAAQARRDQAAAQYQKAALDAYREVANALVTVGKLGEARLELEDGVEDLRDAAALARSRYDAGLANYLEILDADQQLFDQELAARLRPRRGAARLRRPLPRARRRLAGGRRAEVPDSGRGRRARRALIPSRQSAGAGESRARCVGRATYAGEAPGRTRRIARWPASRAACPPRA